MNKLEVGMYYRYKETFGKYVKHDLVSPYFTNQNKYCWHEIANGGRFSHNIIDLIEDGDYVNGMEVMEADWFNENGEYEEGLAFPMYASDDLQVIENWLPLRSVNIKSIVTKKQFENMEYKVGDSNE